MNGFRNHEVSVERERERERGITMLVDISPGLGEDRVSEHTKENDNIAVSCTLESGAPDRYFCLRF